MLPGFEVTQMNDADTQPDDPQLYKLRNHADYVINCAQDWISRFHQNADPSFLRRLSENIRTLSRKMQGRSTTDIEDATTALLETQSKVLLIGAPSNFTPSLTVPRIHREWREIDSAPTPKHASNARLQRNLPIFVSYAHADHNWLDRLRVHLRPLERNGRVKLWHDRKIRPGDDWRREIEQALHNSSVAILIVSSHFMASDFIYANELPPLVQRAKRDGVSVFPLMVGHCLFDEDEFLSNFQTFNDPEWPLSRLDSPAVDRVLVNLAKAVLEISGQT